MKRVYVLGLVIALAAVIASCNTNSTDSTATVDTTSVAVDSAALAVDTAVAVADTSVATVDTNTTATK